MIAVCISLVLCYLFLHLVSLLWLYFSIGLVYVLILLMIELLVLGFLLFLMIIVLSFDSFFMITIFFYFYDFLIYFSELQVLLLCACSSFFT